MEKKKLESAVFELTEQGDSLDVLCAECPFLIRINENGRGRYDVDLVIRGLEYNPGSITDVDLRVPRYRKALIRRVKEAASMFHVRVTRYKTEELDRILAEYAGAGYQVVLGPLSTGRKNTGGHIIGPQKKEPCSDCTSCKCGK